MQKASCENIERVIRHMSENIGVRLAGSAKEYEAGKYLQNEFLKYVPNCVMEPFSVTERCVDSEELEIRVDGKWQKLPCSLLGASPTTDGKTLEAEVVFLDAHTAWQREDLSFVSGKAVMHYGVHIHNETYYKRLMAAKPAFLIMVDTRAPADIPMADGLFPIYVAKYGTVPTTEIPFFQAWDCIRGGADRAKLTVCGTAKKSTSYNIVAELPGTDPDGRIIYAGGHHDTQAGVPGADDNAVGCAVIMELARMLSAKPHKRTIRFISFGTEEQLSRGSAAYVTAHKDEIAKGGFICNFDECGTSVGWNAFVVNATPAAQKLLKEYFNSRGVYYESVPSSPFNDSFPFIASGIGGFSCERYNKEDGVWYHHRADDVYANLSAEIIAKNTECSAAIMEFLADTDDISPFVGIDPAMADIVKQHWSGIYGEGKMEL